MTTWPYHLARWLLWISDCVYVLCICLCKCHQGTRQILTQWTEWSRPRIYAVWPRSSEQHLVTSPNNILASWSTPDYWTMNPALQDVTERIQHHPEGWHHPQGLYHPLGWHHPQGPHGWHHLLGWHHIKNCFFIQSWHLRYWCLRKPTSQVLLRQPAVATGAWGSLRPKSYWDSLQ